ncbi:MAG: response regulator [Burkholderiales bacterium]|nr:response regulator [Burkholderiales bacterium]
MHSDKYTIYVIDPDEAVHDALKTLLFASGMRVESFLTAEAFLDVTRRNELARGCLLVEAELPGIGSLALVRELHDRGIDLQVIVLASTSDRGIIAQALKAGAADVLTKPLVQGRLLDRLKELTGNAAEIERDTTQNLQRMQSIGDDNEYHQ